MYFSLFVNLTLKCLLKYLVYKHFEIQTPRSVESWIQLHCLKDAYCSVKTDNVDDKTCFLKLRYIYGQYFGRQSMTDR